MGKKGKKSTAKPVASTTDPEMSPVESIMTPSPELSRPESSRTTLSSVEPFKDDLQTEDMVDDDMEGDKDVTAELVTPLSDDEDMD